MSKCGSLLFVANTTRYVRCSIGRHVEGKRKSYKFQLKVMFGRALGKPRRKIQASAAK